jgi:hypothetical protein
MQLLLRIPKNFVFLLTVSFHLLNRAFIAKSLSVVKPLLDLTIKSGSRVFNFQDVNERCSFAFTTQTFLLNQRTRTVSYLLI